MRARLIGLLAIATGCHSVVGQRSSSLIGGTADPNDWQAGYLSIYDPVAKDAASCSSAVIAPHLVLTAAHCLDKRFVGTGRQFFLVAGNPETAAKDRTAWH